MKGRFWTSVFLSTLGLFLVVSPVVSDVWMDPRYNRKKPKINWRNADGTPKRVLVVAVDPNAPDDFKDDVEKAIKNWNQASGETGWTFAKPKNPKDTKGSDIVVRTGNVGDALGRATPYNKKKKTQKVWVDIDKNGGSRGWEKPTGNNDPKKWNRERIIKHELGHAIGIEHTHNLKVHPGDVMADGTTQSPAEDTPTLTGHDKKEAKAAADVSALAQVRCLPAYRRTGIAGRVHIAAGPGTDLTLDHALGVSLNPGFPGEMTMNLVGVTPVDIEVDVLVVRGASSDQPFSVDVTYPFGTRRYGGALIVGPDDNPGLLPECIYRGPAVETFDMLQPVVLDGRDSLYDALGARVWPTWQVDGLVSSSNGYWVGSDQIGPGIHSANLVVKDRWGNYAVAQKTLIVGTSTVAIRKQTGGGRASELLIDPILQDEGVRFAVGHADPVTGQVLYSESDGLSMTSEAVALIAPGPIFTSLAVDPNSGLRQLAFYDPGAQSLFHATRLASGDWVVEQVPDPTGGDVGAFCAVAVDSQGRSFVAYANRTTHEIALAVKESGVWFVETVAAYTGVEPWVRMEVDHLDQPHVAWTNQGSVFHAKRVEELLPQWRITPVAFDGSPHPGSTIDLEMNGDGDPVITYVNAGNVPTIAHHDGYDWQLDPTFPAATEPLVFSTIIDEGNEVHIAYYEHDGLSLQLIYVARMGGDWTEQVLDPDVGVIDPTATGIGLTDQHTPCVSYAGAGPGGDTELRVACVDVLDE